MRRDPRVLVLTHSLSAVDGVGRYACGTLRFLAPHCARIDVHVGRRHRGFSEDFPVRDDVVVHEDLPIDHFPFLAMPKLARLLAARLPALVGAARRADVVHSFADYPLGFLAVLAARVASKPVVVSGHGTYSVAPLGMAGHRRLIRWMFAHTDRFLMGAPYALEQVRAVARPRGAEVVPYGVVPGDYDADKAGDERPGVPSPYVLCIGEVKQRKGYTVSLPAFLSAWRQRPALHFAVVGRFDEASDYGRWVRATIDEAGAGAHVHLLGNVSEARKVALCRGCESFLLTPMHSDEGGFEAFGLVYLETGAAGRPVVGVLDSGAQDAITDGMNGFLRAREDVDGLADCLVRLHDDPELADRMGAEGRRRAHGQTWEMAAARVRQIYGELLGGDFAVALEDLVAAEPAEARA